MMQLHLRLKNEVEMTLNDDAQSVSLKWQTARSEEHRQFDQLTAGLSSAMCQLVNGGAERQQLYNEIIEQDGIGALFRMQHTLRLLDASALLHHELRLDNLLLLTLVPHSSHFRFRRLEVDPQQLYLLSRFAFWHREIDTAVLETPQGTAYLLIHDPGLIALLGLLIVSPQSCATLRQHRPEFTDADWQQLFGLFLNANLLTCVSDNGEITEDQEPALRQWEFHDLLFHARTRIGRNKNGYGDTYRFWGELPSPPVVKPIENDQRVLLKKPDLDELLKNDISLARAMESRQSAREYDDENPITADQIGEFLFRVARIKEQFDIEQTRQEHTELWTLSRRAYPGGGALYGLELYLTVRHCEGLESGFYHYDPCHHHLVQLSLPTAASNRLLQLGTPLAGSQNTPQILITIAARFQRVSWKYEGMAYALILKECGVLYQSMYLVATSMDLAACALGGGDADLFAQIAQTDYYSESSIGEFALGSPRAN